MTYSANNLGYLFGKQFCKPLNSIKASCAHMKNNNQTTSYCVTCTKKTSTYEFVDFPERLFDRCFNTEESKI